MKGQISAPAASRKVGKRTYKRLTCHTTVAAAKKRKSSLNRGGYSAMVVGKCVYKGPKLKTAKKTTARRRRRA